MTDDTQQNDGTALTRREFAKMGAVAATTALGVKTAAASDHSLAFRSAGELAALIASGDVSSVEFTRYFIDRIKRHDGAVNTVVVRDFDRALEAAQAADAALAADEAPGPLHSVPMTIKESYDIGGLPTSWGNPEHRNAIAEADSVVVSRFKAAGAHFLGKTNVPIHLADFQSYNDIHGQTNNPWDVTRGPGGPGGRPDQPRMRLRHRRVDPQPGPLLRCLRPQAELGDRAEPQPQPARHTEGRAAYRPGGARAVGPQRRRPSAGAADDRRAQRPRLPRLGPRSGGHRRYRSEGPAGRLVARFRSGPGRRGHLRPRHRRRRTPGGPQRHGIGHGAS